MPEQSYANHKRYVFGFHILLATILLLATVGAATFFVKTLRWGNTRTLGATVLLLAVAGCLLFWYTRSFALRAQDRAIRAEEAIRCFILTGKPLDPRLRMGQIIALRFASDAELPELVRRAAEENLSNDDIKRAVKSWRPDLHRA
jgi:hypothetical protein